MEIMLAAFAALAGIGAFGAWMAATRALSAERRRDQAEVLLTYTPESGLVSVTNHGPKPATGVAFVAGAENVNDFILENVGGLQPGEEWAQKIIAGRPFSIFLSWKDGRGQTHRREYLLDPHQPGVYGDGWPDLIRAIYQSKTYNQALHRLRQMGDWKVVKPGPSVHSGQGKDES